MFPPKLIKFNKAHVDNTKINQTEVEPYNVISLIFSKYWYKATCGKCGMIHKIKGPGITPSFKCTFCNIDNIANYCLT